PVRRAWVVGRREPSERAKVRRSSDGRVDEQPGASGEHLESQVGARGVWLCVSRGREDPASVGRGVRRARGLTMKDMPERVRAAIEAGIESRVKRERAESELLQKRQRARALRERMAALEKALEPKEVD